ncbi:MAG: hypothetical protein ABFS37_02360 [Acidobacteriota bacterium]
MVDSIAAGPPTGYPVYENDTADTMLAVPLNLSPTRTPMLVSVAAAVI